MEIEDALKIAYNLQNEGNVWQSVELARLLGFPDAYAGNIARALIASNWAEETESGYMRLTKRGESRAIELIRAHRLWERYLVDREGVAMDAVHTEADRREHELTPEEVEKLDTELKYPAWDPHGHAIPDSGSRLCSPVGKSLIAAAVPGIKLRIVSIDDEPSELLTQLVALGLGPGVIVDILSLDSNIVRLRLNENIIPISYNAAKHVFVVPAMKDLVPIGKLPVGSRAQVVELSGRGKLQRRMLSMGFVPGAE